MKIKKDYTSYIVTYLDENNIRRSTVVRGMTLGSAQSTAVKRICEDNTTFKILSTEKHIIPSKEIKVV